MTSLLQISLLIGIAASGDVDAREVGGAGLFADLRAEVSRLSANSTAAQRRDMVLRYQHLVACPASTPAARADRATASQTIFNHTYEWAILPVGRNYCIDLVYPIGKGLSLVEAKDLVTASATEFPVASSAASVRPFVEPTRLPDAMPRLDLSGTVDPSGHSTSTAPTPGAAVGPQASPPNAQTLRALYQSERER